MSDLRDTYTIGGTVRVEFLKWDDAPHYHWAAEVREVHADRVLVAMPAGTEFHRVTRGFTVRLDHDARVAFWADRWYSGGPDLEPGTERVREYYFNVNAPPEFHPGAIRAVDLELDVLARPDLSVEEFDWDDFIEAKHRYAYPAWLERRVRDAARELRALVSAAAWPVLPAQALPAGFAWMDRGPRDT